jgi:formate hydrogenlyase subunit 3/multisubunit Na+/H+ antiporter MnhD subunit
VQKKSFFITLICLLINIGNIYSSSISETHRHILSIVLMIASAVLFIIATSDFIKIIKSKNED